MSIYYIIIEFWHNILDGFLTNLDLFFNTNFLTYNINGLGVSIGAFIAQLMSVLTLAFLLFFVYKVIKSLFYYILGFFRG